MNNKRNLLIMIITLSLILVIGSSYAYLTYTKESSNNYVINVGTLEVTFVDSETQFLNLTNMYPMTDEEGKEVTQELMFQVKNTGNIEARYNVYLEEISTNPKFKNYIRFITNKNDNGYSEPKTMGYDKYIDLEARLKSKESASYKVKVWLSQDADNTYMNKEFKAKVVIEGNQIDTSKTLYTKINNEIPKHPGTTIVEDGITYLSGSNTDVNYNYVWYSGKLWRITSINSDGTIKLVTQDAITAIAWGADAKNYKDSWIQEWLNEDFKDTLYNYKNIIVQNANWNATEDGNSTPVRPPSDGDGIVQGDVGLLNAYEYDKAKKNASNSTNYLSIGYNWWLITPYSGSNVRNISHAGDFDSYNPFSRAYGTRPSINLKSNIGIVAGGDGSIANPYKIVGDKDIGNTGDLINTRLSGEYVNVDNKVYRIVGIENETTKLTSVDYVRDGDSILIKKFGTNSNWADSVASVSNDYWGYYLNNTNNETFEGTWLTEELNKYITKGTYYFGIVGGASYKNSICSKSNTTEPTKSCAKTASTWTEGLVGLPRMGEMFSAQLGKGWSSSSTIWSITPYSDSNVRSVSNYGYFGSNSPFSYAFGVRPSITLNSNVYITGGDGMSETTAYTIALLE